MQTISQGNSLAGIQRRGRRERREENLKLCVLRVLCGEMSKLKYGNKR